MKVYLSPLLLTPALNRGTTGLAHKLILRSHVTPKKMLRRYGSPASSARSLRRLYSKSSGSTSKRPAAAMLGGTLVLVSAAVLGVHNLRPLMIHNDAVPSGDLADKTKTLQEASRIPKVDEIDGKLRLLAWGSNK